MSDFKVGMEVSLNNKTYKIVGTVKRSWLLERNGKKYKATSNMIKNIKEQNERGIGMREKKSSTFHMEDRLRYNKIFNPDAKMPETEEEFMEWFDVLLSNFSPENLCCDGELSRSAVSRKLSALNAEWKEVERLFGRKVSEDEVWDFKSKKV